MCPCAVYILPVAFSAWWVLNANEILLDSAESPITGNNWRPGGTHYIYFPLPALLTHWNLMKPILFFDIETCSDPNLSIQRQAFVDRKDGNQDRVNFLPEFGKIVTIAIGRFKDDWQIEVKNLDGTEKEIIEKFYSITDKYILCGWNILWFDLQFITKRWLAHSIPTPQALKLAEKKPWNLNEELIDLARLYQWPGFTMSALEDVALHLNIPTPKNIMHGSEVQKFYDEWKIDLIKEYCRHDVHATALIYQRLKELNFI